jgi:hypothetical protein
VSIIEFNPRAINRAIQAGECVTARYRLDGRVRKGRIQRARRRQGIVEVQGVASGRWAVLVWVLAPPHLCSDPGVPW